MGSFNENMHNRVDCFDGLRGWASISVLLLHTGAALYGWPNIKEMFLQDRLGKILYIIFDGPFAVCIFFVLSGFVLSLNYIQTKDMRNLTGLIIRRIPRLGIPVFISTLIIFFLMRAGSMRNQEAAALSEVVGGGGGVLNTWFNELYNFVPAMKDMIKSIPGVFLTGNAKYNIALWTMRYEFFGSYYIVLFLAALHYSNTHKKILAWILSTAVFLIVLPYFACFNFGMLIAYLYADQKEFITKLRRGKIVKAGMAAGIVICYGLNLSAGQAGIDKVQGILSAAAAFLIVASVLIVNIFQWFFSNKVSRFLGKISFPLYIVHLPVICSFTALLMIRYNQFKQNICIAVMIYSITVLMSLITAYCFYPAEKLSVWVSKKIYLFMVKEK